MPDSPDTMRFARLWRLNKRMSHTPHQPNLPYHRRIRRRTRVPRPRHPHHRRRPARWAVRARIWRQTPTPQVGERVISSSNSCIISALTTTLSAVQTRHTKIECYWWWWRFRDSPVHHLSQAIPPLGITKCTWTGAFGQDNVALWTTPWESGQITKGTLVKA